MLELKLGFMSTDELAQWASLSTAHMTKNKKAWCEKHLKKYADFELVRGGIKILHIYHAVYETSGKKEVAKKYRSCWGNGTDLIDSNVNCWRKLKPDMINSLSDETGQKYVSEGRIDDYGIAIRNKKRDGRLGYCEYRLCKIIDNNAYLFTDEEEKKRQELRKKYLSNRAEEAEELQKFAKAYRDGEITQEEYAQIMVEWTTIDKGWMAFQKEFEDYLGHKIDWRIIIHDDIIKHMALTEDNFIFD